MKGYRDMGGSDHWEVEEYEIQSKGDWLNLYWEGREERKKIKGG